MYVLSNRSCFFPEIVGFLAGRVAKQRYVTTELYSSLLEPASQAVSLFFCRFVLLDTYFARRGLFIGFRWDYIFGTRMYIHHLMSCASCEIRRELEAWL